MPKTTKTRAMPKFTPAPEAMVRLFEKTMKDFPMAEQRKMFSYPTAFVNGHMFAGLFRDSMMLRLPEGEREKFLQEFKTDLFEPMPGRPMREYVIVPGEILKSPLALRQWMSKGLSYAQSLPPKAKAKKKLSK